MVKVKICGITNLEDALTACKMGADALGFIFYEKSPRYIHPDAAAEIVKALPPFITTVGVSVNMDSDKLNRVMRKTALRIAQLHGDETPEYCRTISHPCLKVFRVKDSFELNQLKTFQTTGFLLDTFKSDAYGGTGKTFDWNIAKEAKQYGQIVLSGGLNPRNVLEALHAVQPYAVDTCSGVEAYPGKKDPQKLKTFFQEIKKYEPKR